MRELWLIGFAVVFSLISCSNVNSGPNGNAFKGKTYAHRYFETEEECLEAQPDPDFFINCHQQVDFLANNEVELMLTDIFWRGEYRVEGNKIILSFQPNFEIPDGEIIFEILNSALLLEMDNETHWVLVKANSIWK